MNIQSKPTIFNKINKVTKQSKESNRDGQQDQRQNDQNEDESNPQDDSVSIPVLSNNTLHANDISFKTNEITLTDLEKLAQTITINNVNKMIQILNQKHPQLEFEIIQLLASILIRTKNTNIELLILNQLKPLRRHSDMRIRLICIVTIKKYKLKKAFIIR